METLRAGEVAGGLRETIANLTRDLASLDETQLAMIDANGAIPFLKASNVLLAVRERRNAQEQRAAVREHKRQVITPTDDSPSVRFRLTHREYKSYRLELLKRDPHCGYCQTKLTRETSTLDHIAPQSSGGLDEPANLLLCCELCNTAKKARTALQWIADIAKGAGLTAVEIGEELAMFELHEAEADVLAFGKAFPN